MSLVETYRLKPNRRLINRNIFRGGTLPLLSIVTEDKMEKFRFKRTADQSPSIRKSTKLLIDIYCGVASMCARSVPGITRVLPCEVFQSTRTFQFDFVALD